MAAVADSFNRGRLGAIHCQDILLLRHEDRIAWIQVSFAVEIKTWRQLLAGHELLIRITQSTDEELFAFALGTGLEGLKYKSTYEITTTNLLFLE